MKVKVVKIIDNKTFKAKATFYKAHKKYGKYLTINKNYLVHHQDSKKLIIGDYVIISQTSPISKNKSWILTNKA